MLTIVADENIPFVGEAFGRLGKVRTLAGRSMTREAVREADVLLVRSVTPVNQALLDGSRVRFVGTATIGTDHVDTAYLAARGIRFAYAPGSNADSVADYVSAAMLELATRFHISLAGMTLGVIGVGNVGSRVVWRGEALGMRVLKNDPPLARATGDPTFLPLEALFEADFVTLHVPLTRSGADSTWHMADRGFLSRLKPGAILLNSARGAVVDTPALLEALSTGRLRAAVLDVWENEPRISMDLLAQAAIATPHIAGYSFDGKVNGTAMLHQALCDFLGMEDAWHTEEVMPEPEEKLIELNSASGGSEMEKTILDVVRHVYDVRRDDEALRQSLKLGPADQAAHFDRLRKTYPMRREFSRYEVHVPQPRAALERTLRGLTFAIIHRKDAKNARNDGGKVEHGSHG